MGRAVEVLEPWDAKQDVFSLCPLALPITVLYKRKQ